MSFCRKNVTAFVRLMENCPDLFSEKDRADLNELLHAITGDVEHISGAVSAWYKDRDEIWSAQLEMISSLPSNEAGRGPGGVPPPPPDPEDDRKLEELLKNAIRKLSAPPSSSQDKANE
jgi:hypothetical protein